LHSSITDRTRQDRNAAATANAPAIATPVVVGVSSDVAQIRLARSLLLDAVIMKTTKKLSYTTETVRVLSNAELADANGGTSMFTFTCVCFNVGGNAPGINVAQPRPHTPAPHAPPRGR
jgi:hypothetical protein